MRLILRNSAVIPRGTKEFTAEWNLRRDADDDIVQQPLWHEQTGAYVGEGFAAPLNRNNLWVGCLSCFPWPRVTSDISVKLASAQCPPNASALTSP